MGVVKSRRLQMVGHVVRMKNYRWSNRALDLILVEIRALSRPEKRWNGVN